MKLNILSHLVGKSGVYAIKNDINHKIYIGSAVCLRERFNGHRKSLKRKNHKNHILQNFYNKHGESAGLEFVLLEIVNDKKDLLKIEQWYFDKLLPFDDNGFNILKIAGSSLGVKRRKESVERWKKSMEGFVPLKGDNRKKIDFESKINISKGKCEWIPVAKYDLDGNFIAIYDSVFMAAQENKLSGIKVTAVCKSQRDSAGQFVWRYAPDYICANKIERYTHKWKQCYRVIQKLPSGEFVAMYESARDASEKGGFNKDCIQMVCTGVCKSHKGFIWEYEKKCNTSI